MMRRIFAVVLATLLGTVPVLAETAGSSPVGQQQPQNSSDGQDAYAQDGRDAYAQAQPDGTPSPLLIGGVVLGVAGLVILIATHKKTSP